MDPAGDGVGGGAVVEGPGSEAVASTPIRVTVAVPTFRRPAQLSRVLAAILGQSVFERDFVRLALDIDVLVIDNDPAGGAREAVARMQPTVGYVVEPTPGVAAVRNRALDETASSRLLIFVDDDEEPTHRWLEELVGFWTVGQPDAVAGKVVSVFPVERNAWLTAARAFERPERLTGQPMRAAATNNLLLDLASIRRRELRFDERFGLSGGEDALFTAQLSAAGGLILWCDEALVIDHTAAERMTRRWFLVRAFRTGSVQAAINSRLARPSRSGLRVRLQCSAGGIGRMTVGVSAFTLGVMLGSLRHRALGAKLIARGAGLLSGSLGHLHQEYSIRRRRP